MLMRTYQQKNFSLELSICGGSTENCACLCQQDTLNKE